MKHSLLKRCLALALVFLFSLALAAPALAATYVEALSSVAMRLAANSTSAIVGTFSKGQVGEVLSEQGNYVRIYYGGKTGYVPLSKVEYTGSTDTGSSTGSPSGGTGTIMEATGAVNVRVGPGTSYNKISQLSRGQTVTRVGETGTWSIINWNGGVAYVSTSYLKLSSSGSSGSGTGKSVGTVKATSNVNIRSGPGTSYSILGVLNVGQTLPKNGVTTNGWTIVVYEGKLAYVSSSYVTDVSSGSSSSSAQYVYANKTTAIRSGPSTSYRAIGQLDYGDKIEYLGDSGYWYKVQLGTRVGYVYYSDGSVSGGGSSLNSLYATSTARVYSSPSSSSTYLLGYLYKGDAVTRIRTHSTIWTVISYQGREAYVQTSALSSYYDDDMTLVNRIMYARLSKVYCYSIPTEKSQYYVGYLSKGESVFVEAYDRTWARIIVDGERDPMYCYWDELQTSRPSSSSGSWSGGTENSYPFRLRQTIYVTNRDGAAVYASYSGSTKYLGYTGAVLEAAYVIPRATGCYIEETEAHGRVRVKWTENNKSHSAYVDVADFQ